MWFDSWSDIARVALVGGASYVVLVVAVRISGKRTLAQLNAFDLIVTVALGSVLATILLSSDVSWLEGVTAFAVLILAQFVVALVSSRLRAGRRVVAASPTLLVANGRVLDDRLAEHRLARSEVIQAIRSSGSGDLSNVAAVVLEANGTFSVIGSDKLGDGSALPFEEFGGGRP